MYLKLSFCPEYEIIFFKVSGSPSNLFGSTPGYGLKFHARNRSDLDSGFREDSAASGFWEDSNASGDFKSPSNIVTDLRRRWKKYHKASLYHSSPIRSHTMKMNNLLPIIVMIITLGSAVFTVCMLTKALNKNHRNGKYDSIQYGHEKHMENLQIPHPILDENGVALGGKKASIQFAYNMRYGMKF